MFGLQATLVHQFNVFQWCLQGFQPPDSVSMEAASLMGRDDDWEAPALSFTPRFLHTSLFTPTCRSSLGRSTATLSTSLLFLLEQKQQCLSLCSSYLCCLEFLMLRTLWLLLPSSGCRRSGSARRSARCVNPSPAPCLCATGSATGTCGSPTCSAMIH